MGETRVKVYRALGGDYHSKAHLLYQNHRSLERASRFEGLGCPGLGMATKSGLISDTLAS